MKLGKKIGVVHDPRTLHLADFADLAALPKAPSSWELAKGVKVPMFANDRYGCCTATGQGHRIVMERAHARMPSAGLTDRDVLAVYSAVTGFDPADPSTDNGAYLIDVLRYMRGTGIAGHKIGAYVKVDHTDWDQVNVAGWMFNGLYCGANLSTFDQDVVDAGDDLWKVSRSSSDEPGSWGGHCIEFDGRSTTRGGLRTWGQRQRFTRAWWAKKVDEAWAIVSPDQLTDSGKTPEGFDTVALQNAIQRL
jgi:hypothetical protein